MSGVSDAEVERVVDAVLKVIGTEPSQRWRDGVRDVLQEREQERARLCRCGHEEAVHGVESDTPLCRVCGDNTHCDYADDEEIAADRWDEGYLQAVIHLCPPGLHEGARLMWVMDHMPRDNPYQPDAYTEQGSLREREHDEHQGEAADDVQVEQPAGGQVLGEPDAGGEVGADDDQQGAGEDLRDHVSESPGGERKDRGRGGRA